MLLSRPAQGGFTLLELVVVLAIMAMASVLVIPSIRSGTKQREVRRTVQRFVAAARAGSSKAIRERKRTGLVLDLRAGYFGVQGNSRRVELPEFASFGDVSGGHAEDEGSKFVFEFYPTGASSGGSVELVFETVARRQSYMLTLDPLLSTVGIEEQQ